MKVTGMRLWALAMVFLVASPTSAVSIPSVKEMESLQPVRSALLQTAAESKTGVFVVDDVLLATGLSLFFTGVASEVSRSLLRRRQGKIFKKMQDSVSEEVQKMCEFVIGLHNRQFITLAITEAVYSERTGSLDDQTATVKELAGASHDYIRGETLRSLSVTERFILSNCELEDGSHPIFARVDYSESDQDRATTAAKTFTREGIQIGVSHAGTAIAQALGTGLSGMFVGIGALSTSWSVGNLINEISKDSDVIRTQEHIMIDAKNDMRYRICNTIIDLMANRESVIKSAYEFQKELQNAGLTREQWSRVGKKVRGKACHAIDGWCETLESIVKKEINYLKKAQEDMPIISAEGPMPKTADAKNVAVDASAGDESELIADAMAVDHRKEAMETIPEDPEREADALGDDEMLASDPKAKVEDGLDAADSKLLAMLQMVSKKETRMPPDDVVGPGNDLLVASGKDADVAGDKDNADTASDDVFTANVRPEDVPLPESDGKDLLEPEDGPEEQTAEELAVPETEVSSLLDSMAGIRTLFNAMQQHTHIMDFVSGECASFVEDNTAAKINYILLVVGTYNNRRPPDALMCSFREQLCPKFQCPNEEMQQLVDRLAFTPVDSNFDENKGYVPPVVDCRAVLGMVDDATPAAADAVPELEEEAGNGSGAKSSEVVDDEEAGYELDRLFDEDKAEKLEDNGAMEIDAAPEDIKPAEKAVIDAAADNTNPATNLNVNSKFAVRGRGTRVPASLWVLKLPLKLAELKTKSHMVPGSVQSLGQIRRKAITNIFLLNEIPNPRASEEALGKKKVETLRELEKRYANMLSAGWIPVHPVEAEAEFDIPDDAASPLLASAFDFNVGYRGLNDASHEAMVMMTTANNGIPITDISVGPEGVEGSESYVMIPIGMNGSRGSGLHMYYRKKPAIPAKRYNAAIHSFVYEQMPELLNKKDAMEEKL